MGNVHAHTRSQLLRDLCSGIAGHEFYASEYSSYGGERSVGLFDTFHNTILKYRQRYAEQPKEE